MIYLKTFKLSDSRITNNNIYPFNVLQDKEPDIFIFDNITVLYGNNGSGKSTILNIIAHKLNLKGKERTNPKVVGTLDYFEDYASKCEYELGENENGRKLTRIPENSRYIKSEEILYEIRKIQQDAVLQESIESNLARERGLQNAKDFLQAKEGGKQFARFEFSQDKYSNGETTMQILEDNIEPDNLYLLDEPEVSLSPQNQVQLAEEINKMARYLGVQFIIATHSPFMLGILNAKIYNLDTKDYKIQNLYVKNISWEKNIMKDITLKELQIAIKKIDRLTIGDSKKSDRYFMKFIEEVGELSECIRKDKRMVNNNIKGTIEEELYDVLYYIICLANTYDIDLQNSLFLKEELNSKKYSRKSICDDFK